MTDSPSLELLMPATRFPNTRTAEVTSWSTGFWKMLNQRCLPPWPSARHQTAPPPVVSWLHRAGFCLSQTLNLLHWVRPDPSRRHRFIRSRESRNTVTTGPVGRFGLAGARKRLACQQHFSASTRFSGSPETGPSSSLLLRWHLAPPNRPTHQSRSSRPARTARQYPMLDARYISTTQAATFLSLVWTTYWDCTT